MNEKPVNQQAFARLEAKVQAFVEYSQSAEPTYLRTVAAVFDVLAAIESFEQAGGERDEIVAAVAPARELVRESPYFRRMQDWPRGYQGDFEMVEYLMQAQNRASPNSLARHLEQYGLTSPAAQQHRNKVRRQAELIHSVSIEKQTPRILIVACGSSPDLAHVQSYLNGAADVTLYDYDADALEFSRQRLTALGDSCRYVRGNVFRIDRDLGDAGRFDLIITGGLFDYLKDAVVIRLLRYLWSQLLAEGGRLFFTNMSPDNPDRVWIEYLADWRLIMRDENDMTALCNAAGIPGSALQLYREQTNATILAEALR